MYELGLPYLAGALSLFYTVQNFNVFDVQDLNHYIRVMRANYIRYGPTAAVMLLYIVLWPTILPLLGIDAYHMFIISQSVAYFFILNHYMLDDSSLYITSSFFQLAIIPSFYFYKDIPGPEETITGLFIIIFCLLTIVFAHFQFGFDFKTHLKWYMYYATTFGACHIPR